MVKWRGHYFLLVRARMKFWLKCSFWGLSGGFELSLLFPLLTVSRVSKGLDEGEQWGASVCGLWFLFS